MHRDRWIVASALAAGVGLSVFGLGGCCLHHGACCQGGTSCIRKCTPLPQYVPDPVNYGYRETCWRDPSPEFAGCPTDCDTELSPTPADENGDLWEGSAPSELVPTPADELPELPDVDIGPLDEPQVPLPNEPAGADEATPPFDEANNSPTSDAGTSREERPKPGNAEVRPAVAWQSDEDAIRVATADLEVSQALCGLVVKTSHVVAAHSSKACPPLSTAATRGLQATDIFAPLAELTRPRVERLPPIGQAVD